jgi:hypothetical protein
MRVVFLLLQEGQKVQRAVQLHLLPETRMRVAFLLLQEGQKVQRALQTLLHLLPETRMRALHPPEEGRVLQMIQLALQYHATAIVNVNILPPVALDNACVSIKNQAIQDVFMTELIQARLAAAATAMGVTRAKQVVKLEEQEKWASLEMVMMMMVVVVMMITIIQIEKNRSFRPIAVIAIVWRSRVVASAMDLALAIQVVQKIEETTMVAKPEKLVREGNDSVVPPEGKWTDSLSK